MRLLASGRVDRAGATSWGWPLAVTAICFTLTLHQSPFTLDGYLDLVGGRLIAAHGIPRSDALSVVTHGKRWVDEQWLSQLFMYWVWRLGGPFGLVVLLASLVGAAYGLLAHLCVRLGSAPQRAARWTLVAFLASVGYVSVRAEMFTYPLFALTLTWLATEARRDGLRVSSFWIVPVLALWANLHGGALLGVVLVAGYSAVRASEAGLRGYGQRRVGAYLACSATSAAALIATPYGPAVLGYYHGVLSTRLLAEYEREWAAPRLGYPLDWMTYGFAAAVVIVLGLALRKRVRPNPGLLLAGVATAGLAFHAVRYQPWFGLAAAGLAAATLAPLRPAPPALSPRFLRLGAVALTAITLTATASAAAGASTPERETGLERGALAAAAEWASVHPHGRILADDATSDRLLWWYPVTVGRIGFDARLDFYDPGDVRRWLTWVFAPSGLPPAPGGPYDLYVASRSNRSLYLRLRRATCLRTIYADRYGIVAARRRSGACGPRES